MDEIEDADDGIDDGKLLFIGSNKEKFNFNIFRKPLNFISAIYNGETSLKEAEFKQRDLEKKNRTVKRLWTRKFRKRRRIRWCIDASK